MKAENMGTTMSGKKFPEQSMVEGTEELLLRLAAWGADPVGALQRMLGDRSMYLRLLYMLLRELEKDEITVLVAGKRFHDAFVIAHRMKGSSADLGLLPLFDVLSAVTEDLRDEGQIRETLSFDLEQVEVKKEELARIWSEADRLFRSE